MKIFKITVLLIAIFTTANVDAHIRSTPDAGIIQTNLKDYIPAPQRKCETLACKCIRDDPSQWMCAKIQFNWQMDEGASPRAHTEISRCLRTTCPSY